LIDIESYKRINGLQLKLDMYLETYSFEGIQLILKEYKLQKNRAD